MRGVRRAVRPARKSVLTEMRIWRGKAACGSARCCYQPAKREDEADYALGRSRCFGDTLSDRAAPYRRPVQVPENISARGEGEAPGPTARIISEAGSDRQPVTLTRLYQYPIASPRDSGVVRFKPQGAAPPFGPAAIGLFQNAYNKLIFHLRFFGAFSRNRRGYRALRR